MTLKSADRVYRKGTPQMQLVTLGDEDVTIDGIGVVWDVSATLTAARTVTLLNYCPLRDNGQQQKPVLIIRCSTDASVYNAVIADADGSTLFTFAANYSVTPGYAVFQIGLDGETWVLAGSVTVS